MRMYVTGLPLKKRTKKTPNYAISDHQKELLKKLESSPGMTVYQLREHVAYAARSQVNLALQGLIKRGYVTWAVHPVTGMLKHRLTREGEKKLQASNNP